MEYRTKAAVKIIASLTKDEAFELFDLVRIIEEKFRESRVSLQALTRDGAVAFVCETIDEWIDNGELEVPPHLENSMTSFVKLMASERAQMDELLFEYNRALCPLLQYDLFKADS